jgi:hypothetical protein
MKKLSILIIVVILTQIPLSAQFFKNTIIKTRPFQDIVALNPNLGFEKAIHDTYSAEIEFMYRNRSWNSSGSEGDFGSFYNSDGYRALIGSRLYFGKTNKRFGGSSQKSPLAWFVSLQAAYSYVVAYNIEKKSNLGNSKYTVDLKDDWMDVYVGIGKQFFLVESIVFEFYAGPMYRSAHTEEMTVIDGNDKGQKIESYGDWVIGPFVSLSLGYFID